MVLMTHLYSYRPGNLPNKATNMLKKMVRSEKKRTIGITQSSFQSQQFQLLKNNLRTIKTQ